MDQQPDQQPPTPADPANEVDAPREVDPANEVDPASATSDLGAVGEPDDASSASVGAADAAPSAPSAPVWYGITPTPWYGQATSDHPPYAQGDNSPYGPNPYGASPYGQPGFGYGQPGYGYGYGPQAGAPQLPGYSPGYGAGSAAYGVGYGYPTQAYPVPVQPGYGYPPPGYPPPGPYLQGGGRGRRTRRGLIAGGVAAVLVAGGIAVGAYAVGRDNDHSTIAGGQGSTGEGTGNSNGSGTSNGSGSGTGNQSPFGNGTPFDPFGNSGSGNGNTTTPATKASAQQQIGVVDIDTVLKYQGAAAAGTGTILTSSGEVLTNNHVIDGATSIKVTIVSTGKSYAATVVGTDATDDIAVLKLTGASGLKTANYGDSGTVKVGDSVVGVGNAGGTGGTPSSAKGTVRSLNKTITASDDNGGNSETLKGVIVTDAPIEPGDSGGPLYSASGKIIGVDAAANESGAVRGFAIPIDHALALAHEIESGVETSSIHIGYPAFLAVTVNQNGTGGAQIATVLQGGPAERAGIVGGDVITKVDGTTIASSAALEKAITAHHPGQKVTVTYTATDGSSHQVSLTLESGPAD